jgi:cell division protein FtsB
MRQGAVGAISWAFLWKAIILVIALLVNAILVGSLFRGSHSLAGYRHLKGQKATLQSEIAAQNAANADISREIRLLQNDGRYVERMIRQRLNYVKEHEIVYLFDGSDANLAGVAEK